MKELEEGTNKWKENPVFMTAVIIIKVSILPKATYRFSEISYKNSNPFFTEKKNPKICIEPQ